ncbi:YciC family protein [Chloroflexota bacterium]
MAESSEQVTRDSVKLAPGVGPSYSNGWRQMWKHFLELLLIGILGFIIAIPSGMGGWARDAVGASAMLGIIGFIYSILIVNPVEFGVAFAYLKAARGDKLEIKDMFEAFRNYWNAVLANLLVCVIVIIGFFLLIIPGIIFACKLAFTPYLVVDRKMEVIEAVKESWRMTNGHAWKVFLIGLLGIPISIAGVLCFGVGIIVAIMWITLAAASLYHAVSSSGEVAA